jgi:hypothetical protein
LIDGVSFIGAIHVRRTYTMGQILVITKSAMFLRLSGGLATPPIAVDIPRAMSREM